MSLHLSIVIPSHCHPDLLRNCLAAVTRHSPPDTDILVVDDASRDRVVSRAAAEFSGVRCLRLRRRGGFCAAANVGIQAAYYPIVELLNDDTEVAPYWAEAALAHFQDATVAAVAPLVLCQGEHGTIIDSAGDRYYRGGIAGKRGHGSRLEAQLLQPCRVFGASGSSAFYRREILMQVGAFPESFNAYFEDVDVSFRLRRAGYQILFEPAARVFHRVSSSYGRASRRLLEQQSRNEELVFWRNLPGQELWRALPSHLAVLAAKTWRRWRAGELMPFLAGRLRVMGEFQAILRHRQKLAMLGPSAPLENWCVERRFWSSGCREMIG